ncbi:uncharacterized protein LOC115695466 [Cannabis sativa]|uniref:Cystatin domain-containing protein n=1 Tax=Cannabis sativa TaxID=3483 RepID=A0A7J6DXP7_CANSA|nr:uncharacterized protein LOC115695466 [Cannabis sativa]KAF4350846.1 hypothetical protein G4B88_027759 [Cannabis sativa]
MTFFLRSLLATSLSAAASNSNNSNNSNRSMSRTSIIKTQLKNRCRVGATQELPTPPSLRVCSQSHLAAKTKTKKKDKKNKNISISTTTITKPPHHDNDNDHDADDDDDLMITNNETTTTATTNKSSTETTTTTKDEEDKKKKKKKKKKRSLSPVIIMHARYPTPNPTPTPNIQVKFINQGFGYTPPHLRDLLKVYCRQEKFYEGFYIDSYPELEEVRLDLVRSCSVDDPRAQELAKWAIEQYNADNDKGEKLEFQKIVRVNRILKLRSSNYYVTMGVLGAWHRYYEAKVSYDYKIISHGRCVPSKTLHFCRYARHYPMVY